jgi:prepilin-type N-terminal cleavage/methylation domain-containing protein
MGKSKRFAFTLVELLVVITIIGILVGLLLPAVQAARESGRRTQCMNNIRNLAVAFQQHLSDHKYYPTGGWGSLWMGDPDRGCGSQQPGGWTYNVLPYIEQANLHDLGHDNNTNTPTATKQAGNAQAAITLLSIFNCPTRRALQLYPCSSPMPYNCSAGTGAVLAYTNGTNRSDYAANGGSQLVIGSPPFPWGTGPSVGNAYAGQGFASNMSLTDGVGCQQSQVTDSDVTDGSSTTYMLGEKYINPLNYTTGGDPGDNGSIFAAGDYENYRWAVSDTTKMQPASNPPAHDLKGLVAFTAWGSAHTDIFNMAMCDTSVRPFSYGIDPTVHARLASRNDGNPVVLPP